MLIILDGKIVKLGNWGKTILISFVFIHYLWWVLVLWVNIFAKIKINNKKYLSRRLGNKKLINKCLQIN